MIPRGSLVQVFTNVQFQEDPKPDFEGYVLSDDELFIVIKSKSGKITLQWDDLWYILVNWSADDKTFNNAEYSEKLIKGGKFDSYERKYLKFKIRNRNKWLEVGQQMVRVRAKYLTKKGNLMMITYGFVFVSSVFFSFMLNYKPLLIISGLGAFKTIRSAQMKEQGDFWYRYADDEMVQFRNERFELTKRLGRIS